MNRKSESPASKPPVHSNLNEQVSTDQSQSDENLENRNIFLNFNRAESIQSIDNSVTDRTPLHTDRLVEADIKTKPKRYEIPYMSAYNIYKEKVNYSHDSQPGSNENIKGDTEDLKVLILYYLKVQVIKWVHQIPLDRKLSIYP